MMITGLSRFVGSLNVDHLTCTGALMMPLAVYIPRGPAILYCTFGDDPEYDPEEFDPEAALNCAGGGDARWAGRVAGSEIDTDGRSVGGGVLRAARCGLRDSTRTRAHEMLGWRWLAGDFLDEKGGSCAAGFLLSREGDRAVAGLWRVLIEGGGGVWVSGCMVVILHKKRELMRIYGWLGHTLEE